MASRCKCIVDLSTLLISIAGSPYSKTSLTNFVRQPRHNTSSSVRGASPIASNWPWRVATEGPESAFAPFGSVAIEPFARGTWAGACGARGRLRHLPALGLPQDPLSTKRRQADILVNVHPVLLRESVERQQLQLARSGPNDQTIESSHLATTPMSAIENELRAARERGAHPGPSEYIPAVAGYRCCCRS